MSIRISQVSLLAIICVLSTSSGAFAEDAATTAPTDKQLIASDEIKHFTLDYFSSFQVNTANDIIAHIPGFVFKDTDPNIRGYAGAAGNVLIDGQRPASKDESLSSILQRISVSQIERIELITGGAAGIDMQGQNQVLNIIKKTGNKPSYVLSIGSEFWQKKNYPSVEATYNSTKNGVSTELSLSLNYFNDEGAAPGKRVSYFPTPALDTHPILMSINSDAGGLEGNYKFSQSRKLFGGKLSYALGYAPTDYDFDAVFVTNQNAIEHLDWIENKKEASVQFEKQITPKWKLDSNILWRHARLFQDDLYTDNSGPSHFNSIDRSQESIFTTKLSWAYSDTIQYQFGFEYAANALDSTSSFLQGLGPAPTPTRVNVNEDRSEYSLLGNYKLTPKLTLEAGLKVETSTISVKQSHRATSFIYPKPKLQLTYRPTENLKFELGVERSVSQLDFRDFIADVDLQNNSVQAGNTQLVPQKENATRLSVEYNFWEKGNVSIKLAHVNIEDNIDHVAIIDGANIYDGIGNTGDGSRDVLLVNTQIPLDRLHLKDTVFKAEMLWRKAISIDPQSHLQRPMSGVTSRIISLSIEQSLPKYRVKWGISGNKKNDRVVYAANEHRRLNIEPWVEAFVEYRTKNDVLIRLQAQNLGDQKISLNRVFYNGLRVNGLINSTQNTVSQPGSRLYLNLKKEF